MGLFKQIPGDHRVPTAKDPNIQCEITCMLEKRNAFIEEFTARGKTVYFVCCCGKNLFDVLYRRGLLGGGFLIIPGMGRVFKSKVAAFEGLMWPRDFLDELNFDCEFDDRLF